MSRTTALLLGSFLLLGARAARAEESVPDVGSKDLPVVGTCAPLDTSDVTRLLVGPTGLSRMDGAPEILDHPSLVAALKPRARTVPGRPSRHSVWITASAAQPFTPIRAVMLACSEAGIFRVGVEVKSEQGSLGYGFPLFLAGPKKPMPAGQARLKGRSIPLLLDRWEGAESNPRRIYALAKKASEEFPPVVAEVSLDVNLSVQHVLTCLDMLYRGGCAGVRVGFRNPMVGRSSRIGSDLPGSEDRDEKKVPTHLVAKVGKDRDVRVLPATEPNLELPPIAPRKDVWGDDGPNAPGVLDLELEPLPVGPAGTKAKTAADEPPLPTYAGVKEGAPTSAVVAANTAITAWTGTLGKVLTDALNLKWDRELTPTRFVTRLRGAERIGALLTPVATMFPRTQRVTPSTLRLDVYLLNGTAFVGKVETTLHVAGSAMSFVFARWVREPVAGDVTIPPAVSDPFAAGVPGHLRVWLEATFSAVYRQGAEGLPLAPVNEVLAQLPAIAQASSTAALGDRKRHV